MEGCDQIDMEDKQDITSVSLVQLTTIDLTFLFTYFKLCSPLYCRALPFSALF